MPAAVEQQILAALVSLIQNLSLSGIPSTQIVQRMLPKVDETIDLLPAIFVCPNLNARQEVTYVSFEPSVDVKYPIDTVVIAANNRDYLTNLPTYELWREQIRNSLRPKTLSAVPQVWDMEFSPESAFDKRLLNQQYLYLAVPVVFHSIE